LASREYRLQVVWDWPTLDYDHAHRVHDNHEAAAAHALELIEAGCQDVRIQHQQSYIIDIEIDTAAGLHDDDVIGHNDPLNPEYIIVDKCFESAESAMKPFCVSQCTSANSYEGGTCPRVPGAPQETRAELPVCPKCGKPPVSATGIFPGLVKCPSGCIGAVDEGKWARRTAESTPCRECGEMPRMYKDGLDCPSVSCGPVVEGMTPAEWIARNTKDTTAHNKRWEALERARTEMETNITQAVRLLFDWATLVNDALDGKEQS